MITMSDKAKPDEESSTSIHSPLQNRSNTRAIAESILATKRIRKQDMSSVTVYMLCAVVYLPFGIFLLVLRTIVLLLFVLLGALFFPRQINRKIAFHIVFPILGFRSVIHGLDELQQVQQSFFILSLNHVSYIDSAMVCSLLEQSRGTDHFVRLTSTLVGGTFQWALLRRLGLIGETICTRSVHSTPGELAQTRQALRSLAQAPENQARALLLFPEGQVHNCDKGLLRYKKFCFGLNSAVLPVACSLKVPWPVNLWVLGDIPGVSFALHLFLPWVRWEYQVLPLCFPKPEESEQEFASRIQQITAQNLGILASDLSVRDVIQLENSH